MLVCHKCGEPACNCRPTPKIIRIVGDYDPTSYLSEKSPEERERELEEFGEMKKAEFSREHPE